MYEDMTIEQLQAEISRLQLELFRRVAGDQARGVTVGGCCCHRYKTGESSGGWLCPVHGHVL